MVEALKKMDKKFLIMFICMIMLPILFIIILAVAQGCSNKKMTYEKYEQEMLYSAEKYIDDKKISLKNEGDSYIVKLSDLIDKEYINPVKKDLNDDSCDGKVIVRRNGSSIEENEGGYLNYISVLDCDKYKTNTLMNLIMNDLTTNNAGLYKQGDSYIFRGTEVNNYIKFSGQKYRILSVDANGIAKLIKEDSETNNSAWDLKYNIDSKTDSGISIYQDSSILEKLKTFYLNEKKIKKDLRKHLVAQDICIGKRSTNDMSLTSDSDCLQILEKQFVSLINITDFASASLDPNCDSLVAKSCKNYNYLKKLSLWTWTVNGVTDNSYEVYYLGNGIIRYKEASSNEAYNVVIYIDSNEYVSSGKGTKNSPYVIE